MWALAALALVASCGRVGFDPIGAGADARAPTTGLVGWWKLDDGGGSIAVDSSGQGNTAMLVGATATWISSGKVGGALTLANTAHLELISTNGFPTTGSLTVSAWINLPAVQPSAIMSVDPRVSSPWEQSWVITAFGAGESPCSAGLYWFVASDGSGGGGSLCNATALTATGTWYHVAGVYNASVPEMAVYLNGKADNGSFVSGSAPSAMYYSPSYFGNIGEMSASWRFQGTLDDIRVYDRALEASEIAELYSATGGT